MAAMLKAPVAVAIIAAVAAFSLRTMLVHRLMRNLFTPAIPRAVQPNYPLVSDMRLASDITVVVGTKDAVTPSITQLQHLDKALPAGVRVIYTYPTPLWADAREYEYELRKAAGGLARRLKLLPVSSFSNPFDAWLRAAPHISTKYTLLMHNDVFLLDSRGHFLSELHGALEVHPEHTVAAPQIYETEFKGLLTTHLFNTNLHLRLNAAGVAIMSHEVDLVTGLSREPADFQERLNRNFLEDHVFLVRTSAVDATFIDPAAAFTLEYVDLQLNMLRRDLLQLYVPSARAEFRLWEFGWRDVPYFVRRRSEEQARQTKHHLEKKWGVEFPNTGFCNFVKFSVIRHVSIGWAQMPTRWHEQAGLVMSWFEMVGFNRFNDMTLGEALPTIRSSNRSPGLQVKARRELVSTTEVEAGDWKQTGIGDLLHFQASPKRLETRYQVEHMSLAVLRVPVVDGGAFDRELVLPLCGLLVRTPAVDVCWVYIAPHRYDHPIFQFLERLLTRLRVGPRVALAVSMALTNSELEPSSYVRQTKMLTAAGVSVTMCGEHHWRCEVPFEFPPDGQLKVWRGRINSWPKVLRLLLPHAEELDPPYAVMALIVCLGAVATAYSATQAKATAGVLALDYAQLLLVHHLRLLPVHTAHLAVLAWAARYAVLGPRWRRALLLLWMASFVAVNTALISRFEALAVASFVVALCSARRLYLALLTLQANHKPSLMLPIISRLVGSHNTSPSRFTAAEQRLCQLDAPQPPLLQRRLAALAELRTRWAVQWLRSNELAALLCGAEREAMPLDCERICHTTKLVADATDANANDQAPTPKSTPAPAAAGISKHATAVVRAAVAAWSAETTSAAAHVADPVADRRAARALGARNAARLAALAAKDEVRFHTSATEALVAAVRLARVNTGKPLLVAFGNGAHGWSDGVAAEGVALGEERYACDVLTVRELSAATLKVLRVRCDEIAAVLLNPLQGLLAADDDAESFRRWLHELRDTCSRVSVPLIFDESGTGFRLARGGAQAYFGVLADVVCYGGLPTATGLEAGLPVGALCGSSWLLEHSDPHLPLRAGTASGVGGVLENPALMASTAAFLDALDAKMPPAAPEAAAMSEQLEPEPLYVTRSFESMHELASSWVDFVNAALFKEELPMRLVVQASVWAIRFDHAGRYHWMLQYMMHDQGFVPVWLSPNRLAFPHEHSRAELEGMRNAILRAARRMRAEGWWAEPSEIALNTDARIKVQISKEVMGAIGWRVLAAVMHLLPLSVQAKLRGGSPQQG